MKWKIKGGGGGDGAGKMLQIRLQTYKRRRHFSLSRTSLYFAHRTLALVAPVSDFLQQSFRFWASNPRVPRGRDTQHSPFPDEDTHWHRCCSPYLLHSGNFSTLATNKDRGFFVFFPKILCEISIRHKALQLFSTFKRK